MNAFSSTIVRQREVAHSFHLASPVVGVDCTNGLVHGQQVDDASYCIAGNSIAASLILAWRQSGPLLVMVAMILSTCSVALGSAVTTSKCLADHNSEHAAVLLQLHVQSRGAKILQTHAAISGDGGKHWEAVDLNHLPPSSILRCMTNSGEPCIFGLHPKDEGSHCIADSTVHRSLGWCYTALDLSSWGVCDQSCEQLSQDILQSHSMELVKGHGVTSFLGSDSKPLSDNEKYLGRLMDGLGIDPEAPYGKDAPHVSEGPGGNITAKPQTTTMHVRKSQNGTPSSRDNATLNLTNKSDSSN